MAVEILKSGEWQPASLKDLSRLPSGSLISLRDSSMPGTTFEAQPGQARRIIAAGCLPILKDFAKGHLIANAPWNPDQIPERDAPEYYSRATERSLVPTASELLFGLSAKKK